MANLDYMQDLRDSFLSNRSPMSSDDFNYSDEWDNEPIFCMDCDYTIQPDEYKEEYPNPDGWGKLVYRCEDCDDKYHGRGKYSVKRSKDAACGVVEKKPKADIKKAG